MVPTNNNLRIIKTKNMKFSKLFLAFFLGAFTVSAQTFMPDDNFEAWCELLDMVMVFLIMILLARSAASFTTLLPIDNVGDFRLNWY